MRLQRPGQVTQPVHGDAVHHHGFGIQQVEVHQLFPERAVARPAEGVAGHEAEAGGGSHGVQVAGRVAVGVRLEFAQPVDVHAMNVSRVEDVVGPDFHHGAVADVPSDAPIGPQHALEGPGHLVPERVVRRRRFGEPRAVASDLTDVLQAGQRPAQQHQVDPRIQAELGQDGHARRPGRRVQRPHLRRRVEGVHQVHAVAHRRLRHEALVLGRHQVDGHVRVGGKEAVDLGGIVGVAGDGRHPIAIAAAVQVRAQGGQVPVGGPHPGDRRARAEIVQRRLTLHPDPQQQHLHRTPPGGSSVQTVPATVSWNPEAGNRAGAIANPRRLGLNGARLRAGSAAREAS